MEEVIEPVSKELIIAELTEDKRLRMTNKSNNQIYIITYQTLLILCGRSASA